MADEKSQIMTTDAGRPVGDNQNSLTVGPRGPVVFEDYLLFEKMAHFNRERIPERVVHAKGSGRTDISCAPARTLQNIPLQDCLIPLEKRPLRLFGFRQWAVKRDRLTQNAIHAGLR